MNGSQIIKEAKKYIGKKGLQFCKDYGYSYTVDWCVIFIWDIFRKARASKYIYGGEKFQNVGTLNTWCKIHCKKVSIKEARAGDIIIESWGGVTLAHAGIVTRSINSNCCETVEGNAGDIPNTQTVVRICTRYKQNIHAIYRIDFKEATKPVEPSHKKESLETMVKNVLSNKYGSTAKTKAALGSNYSRVMKEAKRIETLTRNAIRGDYGNGMDRKKALGKDYNLVQWNINRVLL